MFGFWNKNKKIDTWEIKQFNDAIRTIKSFIVLSEWPKARKAIEEIEQKENEWLNKAIEEIKIRLEDKPDRIEIEKSKYVKIFQKRQKEIIKLKNSLSKLEIEYTKRIAKERFKIRFQKIKNEITNLIWNDRSIDAMTLLKRFLEENKENWIVIDFYNSEKKKVIASIEKQRKKEQEKIKHDAKKEALSLIWRDIKIKNFDEEESEEKKEWFFGIINKSIKFSKELKEKRRLKKIQDEVLLMIEEWNKVDDDIKLKKLENVHKWLTKELNNKDMIWYDIYWKILWADKISGDTFWLEETKDDYIFFIWDATGHGIRAWFIITILNKTLRENIKKAFNEIVFLINNWLKQDLNSRNFITGIFYKIKKENNTIEYIGMGHEPMLIYRKKTNTVEKLIAGWIAGWIRIIKNIEDVKTKSLELEQWDIVMVFSDWIIENKWINWDYYWIEKLIEAFSTAASNQDDIKVIYDFILNDVKLFKWSWLFNDDATMVFLRRNEEKDIVKEDDEYIEDIKNREWLWKKELKQFKWKNKEEIEKEVEKLRRKKETDRVVKSLQNLWYTWEVLRVKEEAIRFIKKWFIDEKINYYLKKAMDNEKIYKVKQKNQKLSIKYTILNELLKKWDTKTVISEIEDIIAKDGNV